MFGQGRVIELLTRVAQTTVPAGEVLRRLLGAVLEHRASRLEDDAATVLLDWHGANRLRDPYQARIGTDDDLGLTTYW